MVVPVTLATTLVVPLLQLAEAGRGIASLPDFLVRERLRDGSLVEVLPGRLGERGVLRLLWPASRHPLPKVDFLTERIGRQLAEPSRPVALAR